MCSASTETAEHYSNRPTHDGCSSGLFSVVYGELAGSHDEAAAFKARAIPAVTSAYESTRR